MAAASVHVEGADPPAPVGGAGRLDRARLLGDLSDAVARAADDVEIVLERVAECVCAAGAGACTVVVSADADGGRARAVARLVVDPGLEAWAREGMVFDGPVFDGPVFDGPVFDGPVFDGPVFDGPVFDGPVLGGRAFDGPAFDAVPGGAVPGAWQKVATVAVPLVARGRRIGQLRAARRAPGWFDAGDREFVAGVADCAALALDTTLEHARAEELAARCARLERMAEAGQLAAGVAHDISNLVTVIKLYAELLEQVSTLEPAAREPLAAIRAQADRAVALAWEVLDTARREPLDLVDVDVALFLHEFAGVVRRMLPPGVSIDVVVGRLRAWARAEPSRLQQILTNLVANAAQALPDGGAVTLTVAGDVTGQKDGPPGSWVRIDVADTGDGISPSVLPHVFEPFFSTKSPGRGSGLGLSQVRSLVAQHGGDVDIHSALGSGTVVSVWLPAARATPRLGPGGRGVVAPRGSGQLVLVVEDEPDLRDLLVDTLTTLGYRAEAVADGDAALRWLRRRGHCADVILSEVAMAGLGGEGLARRVHGAWPHLPVILTTSQAVAPTAPGLSLRAGDVSRLRKPFSTEQLAAAIARALR